MANDSKLYADIMEKLTFEPMIDPAHITFSVQDGVVTLRGTVSHYPEKKAVERAVRGIQGVKGIANDLEVNLLPHFKRDDTDITKAAIDALAWNVSIPSENIKVTVSNGNIKLTGEVNWRYQRDIAEKAVRYLAGVKAIDNQIKVKAPTPIVSPTHVKERITQEFERNALIDAQGIRVEISGSAVTLKGEVRSWAECKEASRAVWSIPGITQVNNLVTVKI